MRHPTKGKAASLTAATGAVCVALGLAVFACSGPAIEPARATSTPLTVTAGVLEQVTGFGSNPAGLNMYRYVPAGVAANAPVVVVLHGCTQHAADMVNAGFDALADAQKLLVVYPEQTTLNNAATCFDWFDRANMTRTGGESLSIKQMVDKMKADFSVDAAKVFVVGFSSGGAEAALLLATWPDVFAAGATFAGIPYDCTESLAGTTACEKPGKDQTAQAWGDLVRAAYPSYGGPWPRLSIWQGTADAVVDPANTTQLMRQWTNVHGLAQTPTSTDTVAGYPHDVYANAAGVAQVETYAITGKDHGFFVDPASGCGTAGAYFLDAKICGASYALAFFGLTSSGAADGGTDGAAFDAASDANAEGGGADGGLGDGGATDSGHDATPGSGGYGGSSGSSGTSGASGSSGSGLADDAGGSGDFGTAPPSGCAVGPAREAPGPVTFGLGAVLGLAALRRRSRKTM